MAWTTIEIEGYREIYDHIVSFFLDRTVNHEQGVALVVGDPCPVASLHGPRSLKLDWPKGTVHLANKLVSVEAESITLTHDCIKDLTTGPVTLKSTVLGDVKLDFKDRDPVPHFEVRGDTVVISWPNYNGPTIDVPKWFGDPQISKIVIKPGDTATVFTAGILSIDLKFIS